MLNILRKTEQLSFDDFLGKDFKFFNKDVNTDGTHKKRMQSLEHIDECDCFKCFEKNLLR